ncbi:MAG: hypothetical protein M3Y84_02530, partial [Acidobacteriota bacterium]|nr:hypothetical protein [Acidobacteriota bacterium]
MRKTSRRSFTKSLAGAIAVVPFASSLASGQKELALNTKELALNTKDAGDLDRENLSPAPQNQVRIFSEHNTPPPALLMEGSLIIEVSNDKKPNWPNAQAMGRSR